MTKNKLSQSPLKLFIFATAFRFSSGQGRCFSPSLKAMMHYYGALFKEKLLNKDRLKFVLFKLGRY